MVTGVGFEPTTSRLWAWRAANCSTPRYLINLIYKTMKQDFKVGDKVSIQYYFSRINGIVKDIKNGFYGIEADGKYFPLIEEENIARVA